MKIYAVIGTSRQTVIADGLRYTPVEGEILMESERPIDGEYVAKEDGTWGLYEPTKKEKLAALDSEYEQSKADIFEAYQTAVFMGDTDLQTAIQADFAELNADYADERTAIINE